MKLKYYMRGLGIGIVVTALLMGFTISRQKEPMTDEEIRQRALEMGMIEQDGVLAEDLGMEIDIKDDPVPMISTNDIPDAVVETEEELAEEDVAEGALEESVDEPTEAPKEISITVSGGDGSYDVASKLKEAGLIEDAAAFDTYLCQNGYDKRIATGTHKILMGASDEEIAKEITTRKN